MYALMKSGNEYDIIVQGVDGAFVKIARGWDGEALRELVAATGDNVPTDAIKVTDAGAKRIKSAVTKALDGITFRNYDRNKSYTSEEVIELIVSELL